MFIASIKYNSAILKEIMLLFLFTISLSLLLAYCLLSYRLLYISLSFLVFHHFICNFKDLPYPLIVCFSLNL